MLSAAPSGLCNTVTRGGWRRQNFNPQLPEALQSLLPKTVIWHPSSVWKIFWFAKTSVTDPLSREGSWLCNAYLECSPLNRKLCWAPGSNHCLTHDNQVPLWVWDLELSAFIWRVCDVTFSVVLPFLSLVFFHCSGDNIWGPWLFHPGCYQPLCAGQDFAFHGDKLQEAVPPSFKSRRWYPPSKLALLWAGGWTWWPPGSLLT